MTNSTKKWDKVYPNKEQGFLLARQKRNGKKISLFDKVIYVFLFLCLIATVSAFTKPGYEHKLLQDKLNLEKQMHRLDITNDGIDIDNKENILKRDEIQKSLDLINIEIAEAELEMKKNSANFMELEIKRDLTVEIRNDILKLENIGLEGEASVSESTSLGK